MIVEVDEEVSEPIEKQEIWQKESQEVERLDKAMREMRLAIREREKRSVVETSVPGGLRTIAERLQMIKRDHEELEEGP